MSSTLLLPTFSLLFRTAAPLLCAPLAAFISLSATSAAAEPPPLISSGVSVRAEPADLRIEGETPGTEFFLKSGTASVWVGRGIRTVAAYQAICTAPCAATLPVGMHAIGLSHDGGTVTLAETPIDITGPGTLHGSHISRASLRLAGTLGGGLALGAGGLLVGLGGTGLGTHQECSNSGPWQTCTDVQNAPNTAVIALGVVAALVGLGVGFGLGFQQDTSTVTFVPGAPSAAPVAAGDGGHGIAARDLAGGSMVVRF